MNAERRPEVANHDETATDRAGNLKSLTIVDASADSCPRCQHCRRPLTNVTSIRLEAGPVCRVISSGVAS